MLANEVDGFNPESKDYQPCDKLHKFKGCFILRANLGNNIFIFFNSIFKL